MCAASNNAFLLSVFGTITSFSELSSVFKVPMKKTESAEQQE
jgi:hypothetical protein